MLTVDLQVARMLELADVMASAAASFNSQQGYDQFIAARDNFRKVTETICSSCNKKTD